MRLHRLKLTNFRQHADTEIDFGLGITAIIGPNGAGKTTLLEAIAWAFYGMPAARGNRDTLRWNRAAPRSQVRVEVEFGLGGHEYRVARTLYGADLYQDRGEAPIANSQQEVTAAVRRVLGMSRDEFFNTYFTGQKELAVMAAMGPTERGKFLSRILGYEKLRVAQDKLREKRSVLRGELAGLEQSLGRGEELERECAASRERRRTAAAAVKESEKALAAAKRHRDTEGPVWTGLVQLREVVMGLDGDRRVAEKEVVEARREFERLDRELAEALSAQSRLTELRPVLARVEPLRVELDRLEQEGRAAGRRRLLSGQLTEVRDQMARLQERIDAPGARQAGFERAELDLAETRSRLEAREREEELARTQWVRDKQDAETKRLALRDQYRDLQAHREGILTAGAAGACPTCARPLGDEYESVLETLTGQLEEIELNGKFFKQRVEQLAAEPADVLEAHARLEEARAAVQHASDTVGSIRERLREHGELRGELERSTKHAAELERMIAELAETYDAERHDVVRDRLRELEPTITQAAVLRVQATRGEQLVGEAESAEQHLSGREERVQALSARIDGLGFSAERYEAARTSYEVAEAAVHDAELTLLGRRGDLMAAEEALANAARRVEERAVQAARAAEVRAELKLHEELDDAWGDLRTELNAQLRPELSDLASAFLADLTDGRYHELELDEQYRLLVMEEGEPRPVISGGEEDVANLALRLAISQMVAERAGQPLSLLVLDEIFGSLDEHRRQQVVALLRRLADRFPQVVLITHIESVRDTVDRVLRVAIDPERGAAKVTEDSGGSDEDVAA